MSSEWFYLMHCELSGPPSGQFSLAWLGRERRACVLCCACAVHVGRGDIVPWRHRSAQPAAALKHVFVILPVETGHPQNTEPRPLTCWSGAQVAKVKAHARTHARTQAHTHVYCGRWSVNPVRAKRRLLQINKTSNCDQCLYRYNTYFIDAFNDDYVNIIMELRVNINSTISFINKTI